MTLVAESSYNVHQVAHNVNIEVQRLRGQVENFWTKELRCLRQFGLKDGARVLECGSGPGYFLEKLLQEFPAVHVTGVEIDPFLVQKSRDELAPYGQERHHLVEGSILGIPFEDNSFDFVIARLVLEHLPDPVAAAREMRRVVKPGGKVVVIDNDFDVHLRSSPDLPELRDLYAAYCAARVAQGGNPRIGRQLPVTLAEAGLSNIDLEVVVSHNRLVGDQAFLRSEGSGIPAQLLKDGFLSREIFDRLADQWHRVLQDPDHCLMRQLFVAVGEKSAENSNGRDIGDGSRINGARKLAAVTASSAASTDQPADATAILSAIWKEVLNVDEVGLDDNFFDIGGDSIYLVDVVAMAQERGLTFTPVVVFEHPTIRSLAAHLTSSGRETGAVDKLRERALRQRRAAGLKPMEK
jgi:ubiquinone/menaquinone biosynthesis C-methylase UbiE/aryl carrier-like protein